MVSRNRKERNDDERTHQRIKDIVSHIKGTLVNMLKLGQLKTVQTLWQPRGKSNHAKFIEKKRKQHEVLL